MSVQVNLLLLLSALLSALTGAGVGARAPQPAMVAARPAAVSPMLEHSVPSLRAGPIITLPRLNALPAVSGATWRLAPVAPLFLSRRRE